MQMTSGTTLQTVRLAQRPEETLPLKSIMSLQQAFFYLLTPPSRASRTLFCDNFLQGPDHPKTFSKSCQS